MSGKPDKSGAKPAYQNYRDIKSQEQSAHGRTEIGYERGGKKTFELEPELSKINETELGLLFNDLMAARRHQDSPHISKRPNLLIQEVSAVRIYFDLHRARSLHS